MKATKKKTTKAATPAPRRKRRAKRTRPSTEQVWSVEINAFGLMGCSVSQQFYGIAISLKDACNKGLAAARKKGLGSPVAVQATLHGKRRF